MSKRHSKAAKEPWLLVISLIQSQQNSNHIVNIYRQRMRIEENFRDAKCLHHGLGLKDSLSRTPERVAILLLIAATATCAAWLTGIGAMNQIKVTDVQVHPAQSTNSLSVVCLGRELTKKQRHLPDSELILAAKLLLQMVINTQLEQGIDE